MDNMDMLARLHIEAPLMDSEVTDAIWQRWHDGELTGVQAAAEWTALPYIRLLLIE